MKITVSWDGTNEDMERLKTKHASTADGNKPLVLVEVQNHWDGNFLVFQTQE